VTKKYDQDSGPHGSVPYWFGYLGPDTHRDKKLDPDPHWKLMRIHITGFGHFLHDSSNNMVALYS
jgi:hypothetical protein